jgi:hypothetical protein
MKCSGPPPANPDEYVQSITGWRRTRIDMLRAIAAKVSGSDETVKWGHLVYMANGPAFLIRAEDHRVLFGFWRGKRLLDIEPRMTGGGKYELRSLDLREETPIDPAVAEQLIREAIRLNRTVGDPQERR